MECTLYVKLEKHDNFYNFSEFYREKIVQVRKLTDFWQTSANMFVEGLLMREIQICDLFLF